METTELFRWRETGGEHHTGAALCNLERLIAGYTYETAGADVSQNRFTQEITARVWVAPSIQSGMQKSLPWERTRRADSLEEAQRWCEQALGARLGESPTSWTCRTIAATGKHATQMEAGGREGMRLFTAGTSGVNAARALAYWEAHQKMTIFTHRSGTWYAVVVEAQTGCFGPPQWRQTSPEELVHLLGEKKA